MTHGRVLDIVFAACMLGMLALSFLAETDGRTVRLNGAELSAACPFRDATGIDCPFCGMTRSFVAAAHLRLGEAFRSHPAGPLLFLAMAAAAGGSLLAAARRARPLADRPIFSRAGAIAFLVVTLGWGIRLVCG